MSAASRWRACLEGWALPQELLAAVPDSPYSWPAHLYGEGSRARSEHADHPGGAGAAAARGSLLDVGAGTGRASLPIAARGYSLTAVERDPEMVAVLRAEAAVAGAQVRVIEGSWPEAAEEAGRHDVVLNSHVVYDVGDLAPFLAALHRAARTAVVLEAGDRHPAGLIPYYRVLHSLARPDGPTGDLLVEVVEEVVGAHPHVERWVLLGHPPPVRRPPGVGRVLPAAVARAGRARRSRPTSSPPTSWNRTAGSAWVGRRRR